MAHQDVVSADPRHDSSPFKEDRGWLHLGRARGYQEQLVGTMEAAEACSQGYRPERTILFGLGHDEETAAVTDAK